MGAFPRKQENHLGLMPTVSPWSTLVLLNLITIWRLWRLKKNFKPSATRFLSYFSLSNYATFSQTQTGATGPLNILVHSSLASSWLSEPNWCS
jgi:hypothetical protein